MTIKRRKFHSINKGLFLVFLNVLFLFLLYIEFETREPTITEYLEAARIQYNNPDIQLEDLYEDVHETLSWVGWKPTPPPDKLEVDIARKAKEQ